MSLSGNTYIHLCYFYYNSDLFVRRIGMGRKIKLIIEISLIVVSILLMVVARGEFFGCGIGSTIHGRLMTQAHNDFIYAIIIEEAGMLAAIAIFALYVLFYFRCIHIARHCKGTFGSLSVAGLSTMIFLQALVNMSVAVGVLPVTGQTLPFISFGGTAYLFMGFGVGVIQSVAADNKKKMKLMNSE